MKEDAFKALEELAKGGVANHDSGAKISEASDKSYDGELVVGQSGGGKAMYGNGAKPDKKKKKKKKKKMPEGQKKEEGYGNGGQPEQKTKSGAHGPSDPYKKKSLEIPSEYSLGSIAPEDREVFDRIAKGQVREGSRGDEYFSASDNLLVNYANVMMKASSFVNDTFDEEKILDDIKARAEKDPFLGKAISRLDIDAPYVKGIVNTFGKSKAERDPEAELVRLVEILKG